MSAPLASIAADAKNSLNGLSPELTLREDQKLDFNMDAATVAARKATQGTQKQDQFAHLKHHAENHAQFAPTPTPGHAHLAVHNQTHNR